MKRLWIALAIIFGILFVGFLGLWHLVRITEQLQQSLLTITDTLIAEDEPLLLTQTTQFQEQWRKAEKSLLSYVHHEALDLIDSGVARLSTLAQYRAYADLASEIAFLQEQLAHIRDAELPNLRNIL